MENFFMPQMMTKLPKMENSAWAIVENCEFQIATILNDIVNVTTYSDFESSTISILNPWTLTSTCYELERFKIFDS